MKTVAWIVVAALLQAAPADAPPTAQPKYMRYLRALHVPQGTGQTCAVLDAEIYPHAAPSLLDMRIFPDAIASSGPNANAPHEVPYAVTLSESETEETEQARVLNLGEGAAHSITFDLEMPRRPYSAVTLELDPALRDFLGTANVTAMDALGGKGHTVVFGSFTIFDLSAQHLSRSTELPLPESTFPYLRVVLTMADAPGAAEHGPARFIPPIVAGAEVPPSREEQTIYTTIAETSAITVAGRESLAKFEVPSRVPVERVEFVLPPTYKGNFSRDVRVTATAEAADKKGAEDDALASSDENAGMDADQRAGLPETVTGAILRVHASEDGRAIDTEELAVPAVLGANLQRAAKVEVAIENGDDQPLPISAVRLEMRQRRLCFDASAAAAGPLALYYGDPALAAPVYDYERLFTPAEKPLEVTLGPQLANPDFTQRPGAPRSFTERHPEVLWIALIAVIAALGVVAAKSGKSVGRLPQGPSNG